MRLFVPPAYCSVPCSASQKTHAWVLHSMCRYLYCVDVTSQAVLRLSEFTLGRPYHAALVRLASRGITTSAHSHQDFYELFYVLRGKANRGHHLVAILSIRATWSWCGQVTITTWLALRPLGSNGSTSPCRWPHGAGCSTWPRLAPGAIGTRAVCLNESSFPGCESESGTSFPPGARSLCRPAAPVRPLALHAGGPRAVGRAVRPLGGFAPGVARRRLRGDGGGGKPSRRSAQIGSTGRGQLRSLVPQHAPLLWDYGDDVCGRPPGPACRNAPGDHICKCH